MDAILRDHACGITVHQLMNVERFELRSGKEVLITLTGLPPSGIDVYANNDPVLDIQLTLSGGSDEGNGATIRLRSGVAGEVRLQVRDKNGDALHKQWNVVVFDEEAKSLKVPEPIITG